MLAACGGGSSGDGSAGAGNASGTASVADVAPVGSAGRPGGAAPAQSVDQAAAPDATQARFNRPMGLAMDAAGNMYVADSANFTVRRIARGGAVTTLAGMPGVRGSSDGSGAAARFSLLTGIAVDGGGNVYVADDSAIRRITPDGSVTTLAGAVGVMGDADGTGGAARFNRPWGIAAAPDGTIYVADSGNYLIRAVAPDGTVSTYAGTRGMRGRADGSRASATFLGPQGIARDRSGNVYVTDWFGPPAPNIPEGSTLVRRIGADGSVSTMAGNIAGETGPAVFRDTFAIAADGGGNLYLASARDVHRVDKAGAVSTMISGSPAFQSLEGIALDNGGNLYVADTPAHAVSRVAPDGVISVYAGTPGEGGSADTAR